MTPVATPREAVEQADVVVTSAPHANDLAPFLDPDWVSPGALASSVDPGRSWLPGLARLDRLVCDDRAQAKSQHRLGRLKFPGPYDADLAELLAGRRPGRENDTDRVAFVHPGTRGRPARDRGHGLRAGAGTGRRHRARGLTPGRSTRASPPAGPFEIGRAHV